MNIRRGIEPDSGIRGKRMSEVKRYKPVINDKPYKPYDYCEQNDEGIYVRIDDYNELKAQRDALAAENAALTSNLMFWDAEDPEMPYDHPDEIANNCAMEVNTEFDVQVAAKMPNRTYRVTEVDDYDCTIELVSGGVPSTPATDAYLNSVRADAIIDALKYGIDFNTVQLRSAGSAALHDELIALAVKIRAGEPS